MAAHLHGFSLPAWHRLLDGSPAPEVLLGSARTARWDEIAVQLPLNLAQSAHEPPFPVVNRNIGLGQSMLVPTGAAVTSPVAHPVAAFRPHLLGFFRSDDVGLAWMWWGRALGLFAVALCLGFALTQRLALSAAGAALIVFEPGLQLLALNGAPHATFAGAAWLAARRLALGTRPGAIAAGAAALAWTAACFALELYPPFQVGLGLLFACLALGWLAEQRSAPALRALGGWKLLGAAAVAALVFSVVAWFAIEAREPLQRLRDTAYPGARVSTGGEVNAGMLFGANLLRSLEIERLAQPAGHAVGFFLLSPLVAAALLVERLRRGPLRDPMAVALALFSIGLLGWAMLGLPESVARLTPLRFLPAERTWLALGVADVLLLLRYLAATREAPPAWPRIILVLPWTLCVGLAAWQVHATAPAASGARLLAALALNALLADLVLRRWRPAAVCAALAALMALSSAWYNPLVRGGSGWLRESPLGREILAVDRAHGGDTVWASYGGIALGNLFRALGVRSVGGVHGIPQLELWARIDPQGSGREIYNRFAHVLVDLPGPSARRFELVEPDAFRVRMRPEGRALSQLGVTHLLVDFQHEDLARRFAGYPPLAQVGRHRIYALPLGGDVAEPAR